MRTRLVAIAYACVCAVSALTAAPAAQSREGRYAVRGLVLQVEPAKRLFFVSHDRIDGLMDAMTMPFEVRDAGELSAVVPGTMVTFTLVIDRRAGYATDLRVERYVSAEQDPSTARRLALLRRAARRGPPAVAVGQAVPDFTLTDQAGQPTTLSSLKGKVVAVNFVYTRCALPQFCLRTANTFGVLAKRFANELGTQVVLLTITFDPERDTPRVLADYAAQWSADARVWHFLTGAVAEVRRVCALFGVDAFPDEGLLNHTVRTAIVGRDGRLAANVEGNQFTPEQFGDLLRSMVEP